MRISLPLPDNIETRKKKYFTKKNRIEREKYRFRYVESFKNVFEWKETVFLFVCVIQTNALLERSALPDVTKVLSNENRRLCGEEMLRNEKNSVWFDKFPVVSSWILFAHFLVVWRPIYIQHGNGRKKLC